MEILVIGGTRYMGRLAVDQLLDRGDRVTVFSRGHTRPAWWDRVDHILGDRKQHRDFVASLQGRTFDGVIDTQAFRMEDVEAAAQALAGNVGRYLVVSTGSVYLDGKLDYANRCPYLEADVDWADLDYTYPQGEDPYGVGKRHCEKWLQESGQLPYAAVRIPAVMGWDDPTGRMWWWVQRALDGGPIVVPAEHRGLFRTLYAADAAAGFIGALLAPAALNQVYHIAMKEVMSVERWARLIWGAAGHEAAVVWVPQRVIEAQLGQGYSPPLSRPLSGIPDLSRAERDFGFTTTAVEAWIDTTVDWYRTAFEGVDSSGYAQRADELRLAQHWSAAQASLEEEFHRPARDEETTT